MSSVLVAAGDASGDLHAADFVLALRASRPPTRFVGMGGPAMAKAGVELVVDQRQLAVGGFSELWGSLGGIAAAWRTLGRALEETGPDLVVLVDSGGFNLPFARHVRRRSRAPILYYVAPQVWAWRRGRIRKLARRVDRVAVILPFEPAVYAGTGLGVDFVGHPLIDRLVALRDTLDRAGAREALGLAEAGDAPLVVLLPGSRRNEIALQLPIQLESARRLHARRPDVGFVIALAPSIDVRSVEAAVQAAGLPAELRLEIVSGSTHQAMRAADVALAKPGTVTVELALLRRPMVVMGRVNRLSAAIVRRALKVPFLAMPNLIAGEAIVPELLQEQARPDAIAAALEGLLAGDARTQQLQRLAQVEAQLGPGGAAERASRIAEELLGASA